MTDDQKAQSYILDALNTARVPKTHIWIAEELKLAGYLTRDVVGLIATLEGAKLIEARTDALHVRRWTLTDAGRDALSSQD